MRVPEKVYPHSDLTEQIIGASMKVYSSLKSGLVEKMYENALCIELAHLSLPFSQQESFPVYYRERFIGELSHTLTRSDRLGIANSLATRALLPFRWITINRTVTR